MLSAAHLVDPAAFAKVRDWVRDGGVALASPETFLGDEYGAPIEGADDFFPLARDYSRIDRFESGRPDDRAEVKSRAYGKGRVYQFAATPTARRMLEAWKGVLDENGLPPDVRVEGDGAEHFVEAQVIVRSAGPILYLGNYRSQATDVSVPLSGALDCGVAAPVSLHDGRTVPTDGKRLDVTLPPHGCAVLWFRKN